MRREFKPELGIKHMWGHVDDGPWELEDTECVTVMLDGDQLSLTVSGEDLSYDKDMTKRLGEHLMMALREFEP